MTATQQGRYSMKVKVLLALGLAALVLTGCLSAQGQVSFDLMNQARAEHNLPGLANDLDLNAKAQAWADHLAATHQLAHSQLVVPPGSTRVAENVGYGPSAELIHQRLMESPAHRANILDGRHRRVGVGQATSADGLVWIVQLFAD